MFTVLLQGALMLLIPLPFDLQLFISIIFIILLPYQCPAWTVLIYGFLCGLSVDILTSGGGLHATSAVTAALARILYLKPTNKRNSDNENTGTPTLIKMGLSPFCIYSTIVVLTYSTVFFCLDSFRLFDPYSILLILGSSILSILAVFLSQKWFA